MTRRTFLHPFLCLLLFLGPNVRGLAYTLQFTDASAVTTVKWPGNTIYVSLSASLQARPPNIKQGSDTAGAVRRALHHWSAISKIDFVELNSNVENVSSEASGGDGVNLITVGRSRENASLFGGSSEPGRTRIFYNESGNIVEADIALNPNQAFSTDGSFGTYDLEATLTHEIGHMLGLDHSTVMGAVMQPRQAKNGMFYLPAVTGRNLSSDDRAGAQTLYGRRASESATGSFNGVISYPGGTPTPGANVWAQNAADGQVVESAITIADGSYRLNGLREGPYRLFVSSLDGPFSLTDLETSNAGYIGIQANNVQFRTIEIGEVDLPAGAVKTVNSEVSSTTPGLSLSVVGLNSQASSVAVPLVRGNIYTLYVGGRGVQVENLVLDSIQTSSPHIHVDRSTLSQEIFGGDIEAISFDITVDPDAPPGVYTVMMASKDGSIACLVGALSVEDHDAIVKSSPANSSVSGTDEYALPVISKAAIMNRAGYKDGPDHLQVSEHLSARTLS